MNHTIYSTQVLTPEGLQAATISIENGKIESVIKGKAEGLSNSIEDLGDLVIMPGLIDAHVHINQPGRSHWEGFDSATKAAAAGGITSLVDMPLNSTPVTTSVAAFRQKLDSSKNLLHVNCAFWGGLVPNNEGHLKALLKSGVIGMKAFLTHSGIDDFPNVTETDLEYAMPIIAAHDLPLLVHCELDYPHPDQIFLQKNPRSYQAYLKSRPKEWENKAIEMMIRLCRKYKCRTHIVHLSSAEALPMIRATKEEGLPLSVETCVQYLFFNAEEIEDGQTEFKCAPPIRERKNQEQLWAALEEGLIDFVATDHSPAPPDLKEIESGDFSKAWGGIAGIQFLLPALWTAAKQRGFNLSDLHQWTAKNVAAFLQIGQQKGKIAVGFDADLVVWNPKETFTVETKSIFHRHKVTPYLNQKLNGVVYQTYVGGQKVYAQKKINQLNQGQLILNK